jgi:hypothetical protein
MLSVAICYYCFYFITDVITVNSVTGNVTTANSVTDDVITVSLVTDDVITANVVFCCCCIPFSGRCLSLSNIINCIVIS